MIMNSKILKKSLKTLDLDIKDVKYITKISFTKSAISTITILPLMITSLYSLLLPRRGSEMYYNSLFQHYLLYLLLNIIIWSIALNFNEYSIFTTSHLYKIRAPLLYSLFPNLFTIFHINYDEIIGFEVYKPRIIRINIKKDLNSTVIGGTKRITNRNKNIELKWKNRILFDEIVNFICEKAALERDPNQKHLFIKKSV